jgi:indole-3-glycerol phosphate synthase
MNILDAIIAHKHKEVAQNKIATPVKVLAQGEYFERTPLSFSASINSPVKSGIIAEYKRKSPSKGFINNNVSVKEVVAGYENATASCVSVLTDTNFFAGTNADVIEARKLINIPIIRKDFIIDEYQIIEAKSIGADCILLIAANLTKQQNKQLAQFAHSLQLEVLLELHAEEELDYINEYVHCVGVNNRNLKTFEVSLDAAMNMASKIPDQFVKIAESGIDNTHAVKQLKEVGYTGFLMGEYFMKQNNPGQACADFAKAIKL